MALITVSHRLGSKGKEVARLVADRLNVGLFDDRRLKEKALKLGLATADLDGLDEKAPGFWEQAFSTKPERYRDLLQTYTLFGDPALQLKLMPVERPGGNKKRRGFAGLYERTIVNASQARRWQQPEKRQVSDD